MIAKFCADLEDKLTSSPKLFVPGVRNLLTAWQGLGTDTDRAAALADFGRLEASVVEEHRLLGWLSCCIKQ